MCFHSKQSHNAMAAEKRFNATVRDIVNFQTNDNYNGFAFPKTPIISNLSSTFIDQYQWGLIPHWSKDDKIKQYTLNAKIETLAEKPSFKYSINQRCLVLADGFYEWQWLDTKGKQKQKYLLSLPNDELFAFAGIWSQWTDISTGEIMNTYSIVTTEAQGIMREIHNSKRRMPIILNHENEMDWLNKKPLNLFIKPEINLTAKKLL